MGKCVFVQCNSYLCILCYYTTPNAMHSSICVYDILGIGPVQTNGTTIIVVVEDAKANNKTRLARAMLVGLY